MKISTFLCVAFLAFATCYCAHAQSMHQVDPFATAAAPFSDLDNTVLTTGLVAERGNPFSSLYNYAQNLPYHDSLTLTRDGLQMAAVTAYTMAYDTVDVSWLGQNWYKERKRAVSDTLHLGALLVQFDQFAADALDSGLVTIDTVAGKVYDVVGRSRTILC